MKSGCASVSCGSSDASLFDMHRRRRRLCRRVSIHAVRTANCALRRRAELARLRALLPPTKSRSPTGRRRQSNDETTTVLDAAQYIAQLEATVRARVQAGTLPPDTLAAAKLCALMCTRQQC